MTAAQAGVINGVVQRGLYTSFYVLGETPAVAALKWNTLPEGRNSFSNVSIKSYIESISTHIVNVTRQIIGKYGVVEYNIRYVLNPGQFPTGAGDIPLLVVNQNAATDAVVYPPNIYEKTQGSQGISGSFTVDLHDPNGPRTIWFNEPAIRFKRTLEEMFTVGTVWVDRYFYPTSTTGGWSGNKVADGTVGGYEWRIRFLRNPGAYNGFTFPPGSGNVDPITVV